MGNNFEDLEYADALRSRALPDSSVMQWRHSREAARAIGNGDVCQQCRIDIPARRASHIVKNSSGAYLALCDDCADMNRLDRIHAQIHQKTKGDE